MLTDLVNLIGACSTDSILQRTYTNVSCTNKLSIIKNNQVPLYCSVPHATNMNRDKLRVETKMLQCMQVWQVMNKYSICDPMRGILAFMAWSLLWGSYSMPQDGRRRRNSSSMPQDGRRRLIFLTIQWHGGGGSSSMPQDGRRRPPPSILRRMAWRRSLLLPPPPPLHPPVWTVWIWSILEYVLFIYLFFC